MLQVQRLTTAAFLSIAESGTASPEMINEQLNDDCRQRPAESIELQIHIVRYTQNVCKVVLHIDKARVYFTT